MNTIEKPDTGIQPSADTQNSNLSQAEPEHGKDVGGRASGTHSSATTRQPERVRIARLNRTIQVRTVRNEAHAKALAELDARGYGLQPIDVFLNLATGEILRADGEHRTWAREINGETHVLANIHIGTRRDALDFALKCDLGLPRNEDDKNHCIRLTLQDAEWSKRSDRLIALQFGVDHKTVGNIRRQLGVPQPATRIGADGKVRKAPTSTGGIPQLTGRKSKERGTDSIGQMQGAVVQRPESPVAPPLTRQAEAIGLIESILGESNPAIMQEIRAYITGPVGADASVDAVTMVAHALVWGFDCLANNPESTRYQRTPRQCYAYLEDVRSSINARSARMPADEPRKLDTVDHIQQVVGANIMSPDEIHAALKSTGKMPTCSDPVKRIRFLLSRNRDIFHRIEGKEGLVQVYLAEGNPYRLGKSIVANDQGDVARKLYS